MHSNMVRSVKTTTVTEVVEVRAIPVPAEPVIIPPEQIEVQPWKPYRGAKVLYTGPKGAARYEVTWMGTVDGRERVQLTGFQGKVKFFTDAANIRPA